MKFRVKLWCVDGYGYGLFWKHWVRVRDFHSDMYGFFYFALVNNLLYCGKSNCSNFRGFFFRDLFLGAHGNLRKTVCEFKKLPVTFFEKSYYQCLFLSKFPFFSSSQHVRCFFKSVTYFELPLVILERVPVTLKKCPWQKWKIKRHGYFLMSQWKI